MRRGPLAVERFDPVEAGWGDAPVSAHFGWRLTADPAAQLRCEFDFDADGQADAIHEPCSRTTELVKTAALPQWTYPVGKHRPELVVSDGRRRIWAGTDIYANHLDYKPDVHFLEQRPDFLGADVTVKPAPDLSQVVLHFKDAATLPDVAASEVVVGHGGARGYMLRVESVTYDDADLVLLGVPVGLDDVLAGGFFGVRDLPIDTSDVACVEAPCPDEIVVLPDPLAGSDELVELGTLALDEDEGPILLLAAPGWCSSSATTASSTSPRPRRRALRARRRLAQHPSRRRGDHADHPRQHRRQGRPHPVHRVRRDLPRDLTPGHPNIDHAAARAGGRGRLQVHRHRRCERHRHRFQGSHRLADRARDPRERLPRQLRRRHGPRAQRHLAGQVRHDARLPRRPLRRAARHRRPAQHHERLRDLQPGLLGGRRRVRVEAFGSELFDAIKIILAAGEIWKECEATGPSCEPLSGGPVIVRPRDGVLLDCQQYPKLVFRAPGAATTEDVNSPHQFTIHVNATHQQHGLYNYVVNTAFRGGLPEWDLQCVPLGDDGWGECTFTPADNPCMLGGSQWSNHSWSVTAHVPPASGNPTDVATFDVPEPQGCSIPWRRSRR
ncbi:hypothetical protein [Nannocystis pusilla]|uniref:hypothetical protein n=1 Tax=Nannocystis pusilla TaxID=889268 RepID=UPI003B7BCF56